MLGQDSMSDCLLLLVFSNVNFVSYQVLAMLPAYEGKSVLELGAGIGRFTGELAQNAGQVIALDFIENVIKKVYGTYILK